MKENKELQKLAFVEQIKIANKLNLPIVIHTREAVMDTLQILKENKVENTMRRLFPERCFNSVIRYQAKPIITASNERQVLLEGNCKSGVAQDYISLVDEIYNTF